MDIKDVDCFHCKHFRWQYQQWGLCDNSDFIDSIKALKYSIYVEVNRDFGCVFFEEKEE